MKKLLPALLLSLPLLGVSFSGSASTTRVVTEVTTVGQTFDVLIPITGGSTHRQLICDYLTGVHISYLGNSYDLTMVEEYLTYGAYRHSATRPNYSCRYEWRPAIAGRYGQSVGFTYVTATIPTSELPDPAPSCNEGLSESCCEQLANESCADHGGCAEWSYQGPDAIGGERCDFTCYDDLEEPDPNPGDGGGDGGDDGSNPGGGDDDGSNPGGGDDDGGDDGSNPGDGGDDGSNPGDGDDDWDYTSPAPGQGAIINVGGGAGSGGVTVDVNVDTSAIEAWLQILADKPGFNDSRITAAINALRDDNSTFLSQIASSHRESIGAMESGFNRMADLLAGPMNVDSDTYMVVPGVDSDNPRVYDHGYFSSLGSRLAEDTELPADFTSSEFELDSFDISDRFDDFDLFLPNADCIGFRSYNINGLSFDVDWSPLCDIFSWLGLLVVTSAWFFTPFIVFGTSRK